MPTETQEPTEVETLKNQLDELRKKDALRDQEIQAAKLETAKVRALKDFPSVDEEILGLYTGGPDGLYEYAKKIHEKFATATPPPPSTPPSGPGARANGSTPHTPAPAPGPGQQVTPDKAGDLRLRELREQAETGSLKDRSMKTGKWGDAQEYYERGVGDALKRHFGTVKAQR